MWRGLGRAAGQASAGRGSERAAMAVCALLVLLAIWLLARVFWLLVPRDDGSTDAPLRSSVSAPSQGVALSRWHLFGAAPARLVSNANAPATSLAWSLRGTLADGDPKTGMAVIADDKGVERAWRAGDEITTGVRLEEVHADRVVLLHEGVQEVLALRRDEPPPDRVTPIPPAQRGGPRNTAPAASTTPPVQSFTPPNMAHGSLNWEQTMAQVRGDAADIAKRVQVTPVMADGRLAGVRLSATGDAAMLAQFGLRPSDIVTAVNGLPVDSVSRGQQILESLGNADSVRVTVTRDGLPTELTVKLR